MPATRTSRVAALGLTLVVAVAGCAGAPGPAWRPNVGPGGGGDFGPYRDFGH